MNTPSINSEVLRQLSYIADDEALMSQVLKAIKKLAAQKQKELPSTLSEPIADYKPATKAEVLNGLEQACKELKQKQKGKIKFESAEDLLNEL